MTSGDPAVVGLPATLSAPAATVDASRPCFRCGYDLFGQPRSGACPECGEPVAESLRAHYLRDAGPAYLRMVRRAVRLTALTIGLSLVAGGANGLAWHLAFPPAVNALRIIVTTAASSMFVLVAWRITAVPRSGGGTADTWGPAWQRRAVRLAAAPIPLLQLCNGLLHHHIMYQPFGSYELGRSFAITFAAAATNALLAVPLVGLWFARQVRRLPGPRPAQWVVLATAGLTAATAVEALRGLRGLEVFAGWWLQDALGGVERVTVPAEGVLLTPAFAIAAATMWHVDRRLGEEIRRAGEAP